MAESCWSCHGSGVYDYICSEGTCDMTDWCDQCLAGPAAKAAHELLMKEYWEGRCKRCSQKPCRGYSGPSIRVEGLE